MPFPWRTGPLMEKGRPRKRAASSASLRLTGGAVQVLGEKGEALGALNVPVVIDGTYRAMEANDMWIHPARVRVKVLPAIPTQGMSREESKEIGERVRGLIAEAKQ